MVATNMVGALAGGLLNVLLGALSFTSFLFWPGLDPSLPALCHSFASEHERFGVNVAGRYGKSISDYDVGQLNAAWYLDYTATLEPEGPAGMRYAQMIWTGGGTEPNEEYLHKLVDANPAGTWILGNEPDRAHYQDSVTPEQYAVFYHNAYTIIKERDPTATVATAGIVQPTPLRLRYLDRVLAEYERLYNTRLPVDVWTIHNFIIREQRDEWGADIPPGMSEDEGELYGIADHGRMDIFQQHIVDFRQWMANNGYRNKRLVVTEYGILLPPIYGYTEDVVEKFMLESFDYFLAATDESIGYPADGNRLVQAWAWYSLNDKEYDIETGIGFNGNLFDHDSGTIKPLGNAFAAYTAPLVDEFVDLAVTSMDVRPSNFISSNVPVTLTVDVNVVNRGTVDANDVTVSLWRSEPGGVRRVIGKEQLPTLMHRCGAMETVSFTWQTKGLAPGTPRLVAEVRTDEASDRDPTNNRTESLVVVLTKGRDVKFLHLPAVTQTPY